MCIFGRKLKQRIKELEAEVAKRDAEVERLKSELAKTPARGANGRYTNRKA